MTNQNVLWVCSQSACKRTVLTDGRRRKAPECLGFGWTHGQMVSAKEAGRDA